MVKMMFLSENTVIEWLFLLLCIEPINYAQQSGETTLTH